MSIVPPARSMRVGADVSMRTKELYDPGSIMTACQARCDATWGNC
jgi:hypothetical protein